MYVSALQQIFGVHFARWQRNDMEPGGSLKSSQQVPALRGVVFIHPTHPDIVYVQVDGVAEDEQLQQRWDEYGQPPAPAAQQLGEFFTDNLCDAFPHGFMP